MDWDEQILLWNQAAVKIMDIRHRLLTGGEAVHAYKLPTTAFLLAAQGQACVKIDGKAHMMRRFHVLHSGKDGTLEIVPTADKFAYYLVFYKALFPFPLGPTLSRLAEQSGPFHASYHVVPQNPFFLYDSMRRMERLWRKEKGLDHLQVKALFYGFVHELLRQMPEKEAKGGSPDLVTQILRYIDEHYEESIAMEDLAELLDCSISYMSRVFKAQVGTSPIDYLIQIRMDRARERLASTEWSIQKIAQSVGYADVYYFSRLFKKQSGLSPIQFRKRAEIQREVQHIPSARSTLSIVSESPFLYSIDENENHYYEEGDTEKAMYRDKKTSLAAVMLLCLTLLLSACQTGGNQGSPANQPSAAQSPSTHAGTKDSNKADGTRVYKHLRGETAIPKQPKRIVTAFHVGQPMALGVKPLGSSTYILQNPAIDTKGMEDLGVPLNLEKITSLDPDLIILIDAYVESGGGYDAFSKIAPTIVIEPYYDPVKDIALMGDILGKEEEAKRWTEEFEKKIVAAKKQVNEAIPANETFTIVSFFEKSPRVYRDQNMGGNILYKYLGLKPQQKVLSDLINSGQKPPYSEVSAEVLSEFIGDNLFVAVNDGNRAAFESFKKTGIWNNLGAVKNGKVYTIDYDLFLQSDPIAVTKQVDLLTNILTGKNK
ncbi:hypothetical protein GCM10020370_05690 [Paenibacillus hodogayensis]